MNPTETPAQFARLATMIREARQAKGLRQVDLAEALSIRQPAVSTWESGRGRPSISTALELCRLLDIEFIALAEAMTEGEAIPA
jgi:transcriptional regulator with XRE-family HTH domain